jgi:sulfonate transport system substrate-binding protein
MKKISLFFVFVCLLFFSCGKKDEQIIRYGGTYYPGEFLLEGHDFFAPFGITVEHTIFSSGTENNEALISNNIDISVSSDSKSVALFNAVGDKVVIIGTVQRGNRYSTVVRAGSNYKDWADLKGKKVATRFGTGAEFVIRKYFDSRDDIQWDDFQWINLKTEDMISTLDNGQIEAFTVWAPTGEIAESQGICRLLRNYGDVALTPALIHANRKFAEENEELIVKFLAGQLKKAELIKTDTQQAAIYAAQAAKNRGIEVSSDAFELIFKRIDFSIQFDENLIDELRNTALFLKQQGKIDRIPRFYWDTKYIEKAEKFLEE